MNKIWIVAKGSVADVAAAAATHGLAIDVVSGTNRGEVLGYARVNREGKDHALYSRVQNWMCDCPRLPPFPPGTLLGFREVME